MDAVKRNMPVPFSGLLAACCAVLIWSGWVVTSRWGITTDFSPVDLTWLRFTSASLLLLPYSLTYNWRQVHWGKALVVALGCGFPYVWLAYLGLKLIPSANASVLINGFLPVVTSLLAFLFLRAKITKAVGFLFLAILIATGLMAYQPVNFTWRYVGGVALLITATGVLSVYMLVVKHWQVKIRDILAWVPLINAVLLLPFWLIYSQGFNAFNSLPLGNVIFHILYQGVLVSVVGLLVFSYAIQKLGAFGASVFMALVPVVTAFLALVFFHEIPQPLQWLGLGLCTFSLFAFSVYSHLKGKTGARALLQKM